ncbi:cellulose binding domain-containing protein [Streptomyces sp. NPDC001380]|uniref:cellulose binding domain-containing protein n=1 Tax=Streptomyces sp. NPDC001380 TaxID=3364566 RepID=UPI0036CF8528
MAYRVVNQWSGQFQAELTVTSARPLHGWTLSWDFPDGQRVVQLWNAVLPDAGPAARLSAIDWNTDVAAGQSFTLGFLASWEEGNRPPARFSLAGDDCRA